MRSCAVAWLAALVAVLPMVPVGASPEGWAARLGLGPVADAPALNSFFRDSGRGEAQAATARAMLANLPAGEQVVLVTHQVNITALTGADPASGEVFVVQVEPGGTVTLAGRILIDP